MHQKIGRLSFALILALILFLLVNGVINSFSFYHPSKAEFVSVYNMNGAVPIPEKKSATFKL